MSNLTEEEDLSLVYVDKEPNVGALQNAYDTCLLDLDEYFQARLSS